MIRQLQWQSSGSQFNNMHVHTPQQPSASTQPRATRGHAAAQQLSPRSQLDSERGDLLALLPGRPIVADICGNVNANVNVNVNNVTHPLAAAAVKAAGRNTGGIAKEKGSPKRDKYSRTGTGACRFVLLSHETLGHAGPAAFALPNEIAEFAVRSGVVSKRALLEKAMRDLSTILCRRITRQVLAKVPLRARLNRHPVVAGLPVPTDDLNPVAGGPS